MNKLKNFFLSLNPIILFLFFLIPFGFALNFSENYDIAFIRILIPIAFSLWLIKGLLSKKLLIDFRLRSVFLMLILLLVVFSLNWSPNEIKSWRKILFLGSIFPLYWVMFQFFKQKNNLNLFLKIISITAFFSALIGLIQFITQFILGIDFVITLQSQIAPFFLGKNFSEIVLTYNSWLVNVEGFTLFRAIGVFPDPHLFSLFLNICLPITGFLFLKTKKSFYLVNFLVLLLTSLLTFSRAGYLSLFIVLVFLWFTISKKKSLWNLLLLFIFLFFLIIPNPVNQRFYSTFNLEDGSINERITLLKISAEIFKDNFWLGVGVGNLSEIIQPQSETRTPIYAHNLFLDFASEIGFLGGLAVLLLILTPIFKYFQRPTPKNLLLASIFLIILIHSMFETPFYSVRLLPLILTLLAI